jgi:hypothetical protein
MATDLDSCRRITALIEKYNFKEATMVETLEIRFHLIHCRTGCKVYYKQSKLINKLLVQALQKQNYTKFEKNISTEDVDNELFKIKLKDIIKKSLENL